MKSVRGKAQRVVGTLLLVVVLGVVASVFLGRLFKFAGGPEVDIISVLKTAEKEGVTVKVPGTALEVTTQELHFDRVVVNVHADGQTASATATLDFRGTLGGVTRVSSLGTEKIPFLLGKDGSWAPAAGNPMPTLTAALSRLEARRRALEEGSRSAMAALLAAPRAPATPAAREGFPADPDPRLKELLALTARQYRVDAYFLRTDREEVTVTAEDHLTGNLPERPVDAKATRRLVLVKAGGDPGREFLFRDGLM